MPRSRLSDRVQCGAARLIARLPDRAKIALSGEPPVIVDGQQLDPQAQFLRAVRRRRGFSGLLEPSIEAGRRRYRHDTRAFRGPVTEVDAVRDFEIDSRLRVRHYRHGRADASARHALLVYLHGGGFVIGDLDTHDEPCRLLCRHADTQVLSVEYRLAPEHPFPAAVDDARAAFDWARANAATLGVDPDRVSIGGDSAGANLAGAVSQASPKPFRQLLIYPAVDMQTPYASRRLFGEGYVLSGRDCDLCYGHYTNGAQVARDDPRVSLLKARNLGEMPPALVAVAGFDLLRDEGDAFANALQAAGAMVRPLRFPSLEHGFIHLTGVCPTARDAMFRVAREWRTLVG
jgi:acetyl esterase